METSAVAWYAAILSTTVFTWDLAKWWRAEPRLRISAKANVSFADGEVIHREKRPDGSEVGTLASYCHVEIVNAGGRPTTLIAVDAVSRRRDRKRGEIFAGTSNFKTLRGSEQLPVKLGPGEMWSARVDMRQLVNLEQFGPLRIQARAAYREKPLAILVRRGKKG